MYRYTNFLFATLIRKTRLYIVWLLGIASVITITVLILQLSIERNHKPEIQTPYLTAKISDPTLTIFLFYLPFIFTVIFNILVILHIFKSGEKSGIDLLMSTKPILRKTTILSKFIAWLVSALLFAISLGVVASLTGLSYGHSSASEIFEYGVSYIVGSILISLIIGSITIFISAFLNGLSTLLIATTLSFVAPVLTVVMQITLSPNYDEEDLYNYSIVVRDNEKTDVDKILETGHDINLHDLAKEPGKLYTSSPKGPIRENGSPYYVDAEGNDSNAEQLQGTKILRSSETNKYRQLSYIDIWYQWSKLFSLFGPNKNSNATFRYPKIEDKVKTKDIMHHMKPFMKGFSGTNYYLMSHAGQTKGSSLSHFLSSLDDWKITDYIQSYNINEKVFNKMYDAIINKWKLASEKAQLEILPDNLRKMIGSYFERDDEEDSKKLKFSISITDKTGTYNSQGSDNSNVTVSFKSNNKEKNIWTSPHKWITKDDYISPSPSFERVTEFAEKLMYIKLIKNIYSTTPSPKSLKFKQYALKAIENFKKTDRHPHTRGQEIFKDYIKNMPSEKILDIENTISDRFSTEELLPDVKNKTDWDQINYYFYFMFRSNRRTPVLLSVQDFISTSDGGWKEAQLENNARGDGGLFEEEDSGIFKDAVFMSHDSEVVQYKFQDYIPNYVLSLIWTLIGFTMVGISFLIYMRKDFK